MKAVVMCGGLGTRMYPITDLLPKPLLKLAGRPILDILIEKSEVAGADTVYLTLGYRAKQIMDYVESRHYGVPVVAVTENVPLGTAGGVRNAVGDTEDDILVVSGDNIFDYNLANLYAEHKSSGAFATLIGAYCEDPRDYGTVCMQPDGTVTGFVEKPSWAQAQSNIINTGIYFIRGEILSLIPKDKGFDFANDLFPILLQREYLFRCVVPDGAWGDLGDTKAYLEANRQALLGLYGAIVPHECLIDENKILPNGTVIQAPCVVDSSVLFGESCTIGPFAVIGENCVFAAGCQVNRSVLGDGCTVQNETKVNGAYVGDNTRLGVRSVVHENAVLAGNVSSAVIPLLRKNAKWRQAAMWKMRKRHRER